MAVKTSRMSLPNAKLRTGFLIAVLSVVFLLLGPGSPILHAQDIEIITDEDALFGDDAVESSIEPAGGSAEAASTSPVASSAGGVEKIPESKVVSATASFLKTDSARLGGSFSASSGGSWSWIDPWNGNNNPAEPDVMNLPTTLSALFFFEGRPAENFRVYGSFKTQWPFVANSGPFVTPAVPPSVIAGKGSVAVPNIEVFELFNDFSWNNKVFFRFGKHTVKWGVGYFWSPADVLNLGAIDVEDPDVQREGPISLRAHIPVPGTQTNIWAYALIPETDDPSSLEPADLGAAAKVEFLLGNWEVGTGAFVRYDQPASAMLSLTGAVGRFSLFGEGSLSWGSQKSFVKDISMLAPFLVTEKYDDQPFFSGTAGFNWTKSAWDLTIIGQDLFNGQGYADDDRNTLIDDFRAVEPVVSTILGGDGAAALGAGLIYNSGLHYAALSVSKSEMGLKDLSGSVFVLANLSDLSGFAKPAFSYRFFDRMSASAAATFYFSTSALWGAGDNGEYVVLAGGPSVTLSLSSALGGGRF
jgi:hypothetical protein